MYKNIKSFFRFVFIYKPLNEYQAHATLSKRIKYHSINFLRRVIILILVIILSASGFAIGKYFYPHIIYQDKIIQVPVIELAPVLEKIAKCESNNSQTNQGQVQIHVNKDGSYDQGRFQINSIWNATATKLGYNLAIESDNEAFARYLYNTKGTTPWDSSRKCWQN